MPRPTVTKLADEIPFWNILLYADSGTGKTVFAGSDTKVLFVAPEDDGLISTQRVNKIADTQKITIKKWEDLIEAYEWYEDNPEELKEFNVVVIDSITRMQDMAKDYVLRMSADEKSRKGQDPAKMQIQDYGDMHILLENLVKGFNDLPVNILWTATAKKVEDADGMEFLVPDLQGKKEYGIAMKMVSLMTSYGYMRVEIHEVPAPTEEDPNATKNVKRRVIYWEDTGTIRGKDRTTSLTPFTVNMNLQQMRLAIKGTMVRNSEGRMVKAAEASVDKARLKAPRKASPQKVDAVESKPKQNPANTPDDTADITDSVPQYSDGKETEGESQIELEDINA